MGRPRTLAILREAVGAASARVRHRCGGGAGHRVPGGVLIGDAAAYDAHSRLAFGSLFRAIAADIAAVAPAGARVLEVGCGPGYLALRLARRHGLAVTGLDLDPAMIDRARMNADRAPGGGDRRPAFQVGDVAALPFPDGSFDLVVSTLSMHHWADPAAGLAEIGRVLRPDGRALVWDFRPGRAPLHGHMPDPAIHAHGVPLRVVRATPWRWPWRFKLIQRIELIRAAGPPGSAGTAGRDDR